MKNALSALFNLVVVGILMGQTAPNGPIWQSPNTPISPAHYFIQYRKALGLNPETSMQQVQVTSGTHGMKHVKYQQRYKGLKVLGGEFILHVEDGDVQSANGYLLRDIELQTTPAITPASAVFLAEQSCDEFLSSTQGKPVKVQYANVAPPTLNIADRAYPRHSGKGELVWVVELEYTLDQPHRDRVLIDAHTGRFMTTVPLIMSENIEVEVETKYLGLRTITIDSVDPKEFKLQDNTRGNGIEVVDGYRHEVYTSEDKFDWFIYEREYESAQDVQYGMQAYYDMLKDIFGYNSVDNAGKKLQSNLHTSGERSFVNAFWDGNSATFGDGDCSGYGPLTTLDVVGHEFTHGLTQFNSGLVYRGDPGGINEGMSDIFGKALEWYYDSAHFSWEIGKGFIQNPDLEPFRSMQDPNKYNNPKYYQGMFWFDEVHNTSGVLNYWFYLIAVGEQGTNEKGVDYDVRGLGMDKAIQIAFAMNTSYLTSTSDYPDAVEASVAAVSELYGVSGDELTAVLEAWKAVGLERYSEKDNDLSIRILNESDNTFFGFLRICESEMPSLKLRLYNQGRTTVPSGTSIPVQLEGANTGELLLELDRELAQGDSIDFEEEGLLVFENKANRVIQVEAKLPEDEYVLNNTSSVGYYVLDNSGDIDIKVEGLSNDLPGCMPGDSVVEDVVFRIIVSNGGCTRMRQGREVHAQLTLNGKTFDEQFQLPYELPPDWRASIRVEAQDAVIKPGYNSYSLEVSTSGDHNGDNNLYEGRFFIAGQVENGYSEDFSLIDLTDQEKISNHLAYTNYEIVDYNQQKYLGITAASMLPPTSIDPCPSPSRFFSSNVSSGYLEWCAYTEPTNSGAPPQFEFDMVQFRKERSDFPGDKDFQSIMRLTIDGAGEHMTRFYYGQTPGDVEHYSIPLPIGANISIRMDFFMSSGRLKLLSDGRYDEVDAVMISNIRVGQETVKVLDRPKSSLMVAPNPARSEVRFRVEEGTLRGGRLMVVDPQSRKVLDVAIRGTSYTWTTSGVSSGVYFYTFIAPEGEIKTGRLVVARGH